MPTERANIAMLTCEAPSSKNNKTKRSIRCVPLTPLVTLRNSESKNYQNCNRKYQFTLIYEIFFKVCLTMRSLLLVND